MRAASDAVVIGGGVIGCAVAYALAREGASVTLVERDGVGRHASGAAAGMLAPVTESVGAVGRESLALLPDLVREVRELSGIDPQLSPSGIVRIAGPGAPVPEGCEWLGPDELRKRVPGIAPAAPGAVWSPLEGHVHPLLLTRALAGAAVRRGVRLELGRSAVGLVREGDRVTGVRTDTGTVSAADVVLCAGAWTRLIEPRLPVEPVKGQMLALEAPEPALRTVVWGPRAYLVPRADGELWVGATVERAGFDVRPTAGGVASLLAGACELIPGLEACEVRRAWAGLRPGTPDGLPAVGPLRPGLYIAAGHYRNGILLAAVTGRAVADWLFRRERSAALAALDPARFLED